MSGVGEGFCQSCLGYWYDVVHWMSAGCTKGLCFNWWAGQLWWLLQQAQTLTPWLNFQDPPPLQKRLWWLSLLLPEPFLLTMC